MPDIFGNLSESWRELPKRAREPAFDGLRSLLDHRCARGWFAAAYTSMAEGITMNQAMTPYVLAFN